MKQVFCNVVSEWVYLLRSNYFVLQLQNKYFTSLSKVAVIKPRLKHEDFNQFEVSNYHPISNITFPSKILEKTVVI